MNTPRSTVTVLPVHRAGLGFEPWTAHLQQCRGFDVPAISQALKVASEFQDAYGTDRKTLALLRAVFNIAGRVTDCRPNNEP
jgi:hypothetical protein